MIVTHIESDAHEHLRAAAYAYCRSVTPGALSDRDYVDELESLGLDLLDDVAECGLSSLATEIGQALARIRRARATAW